MATTTTTTNKPLNPRAQDLSPKGYNRANIFSGKALDFDGVNDILTMPTALTSSLSTTSVTFATWVRSELSSISDPRDDAFSFSERGVILAIGGGSINYYFRHESSGWDGITIPTATFTLGAWNFMVCTIDLGTDEFKAYVNGRLVASIATTRTAITYEGNALTIGAQAGARFFDGQISGFKIFNTALTPAQVSDLYLNPEKIVPDGVASSALKLWLPMMEGAGASAYDGSGNGNDGTINGATWTAGIGAPVAQTALVSWDKGVNLAAYSEQLDQWSTGSTVGAIVRTANVVSAPNGTTTADRLVFPAVASSQFAVVFTPFTAAATSYKGGLWLRGELGTEVVWVSFTKDGVNYNRLQCALTTSWQFFDLTATLTAGSDNFQFGVDTRDGSQTARPVQTIYSWGASLRPTSAGDAYIKTNATAQTSAVLVPEGLTAGASIFGTDIITPRNAFALNLDGASYAGVHDNASTDLTSAVTLEFWVKVPAVQSGVYGQMIGKRDAADSNWLRFYKTDGGLMVFEGNGGTSLTTATPSDTWTHFVGTINGTSAVLYKNGASVNSGTLAFNLSETVPVGLGAWLSSLTQVASTDSYVENGQLANPRIYNRALTAAEVLRNYNADKAKFGL